MLKLYLNFLIFLFLPKDFLIFLFFAYKYKYNEVVRDRGLASGGCVDVTHSPTFGDFVGKFRFYDFPR